MNIKEPLALRMRPQKIEDIVGQEHLTKKDSVLWKMIHNELLVAYPIILYGPSGTGKTSIANVIAKNTNADFIIVNAVEGKKSDLEKAVKQAKENRENGKPTILFVDEIHRFNKLQQDYLLPYTENGTIILIGATTENPGFEVNNALLSRSMTFVLKEITKKDIRKAIDNAMSDERGMKDCGKTVNDDVRNFIAEQANGDIRFAFNVLELACTIADTNEVTIEDVKEIIQKPNLNYDPDGDMHYNTISAFIKSMRGSDPDATLYWLARMIKAGEDPKFIARRILVHASEDVGNADPLAICIAAAAMYAVTTVGLPEARINLSQAALYVAMAPKSNTSCVGIDAALDYVENHPTDEIPTSMKDDHYKFAKTLGHGFGYMYPHDYPNHWVRQQYVPDSVKNEQFYFNSHMGYEQTQADYMNKIREIQNRTDTEQ